MGAGTLVRVTPSRSCRTPVLLVPRTRRPMAHQPMNDTNIHPDPPPETIRRRITLVLGTEFVLLMSVAALEGFWPGAGPGAGARVPLPFVCVLVVPIAMAALSRPLI